MSLQFQAHMKFTLYSFYISYACIINHHSIYIYIIVGSSETDLSLAQLALL